MTTAREPTIIAVGDDYPPSIDDLPANTEWCVYSYDGGSWEGSGEAYCYADGKFYEKSLGHCSCYGPWDNGFNEISKHDLFTMHLVGDNASAIRAALATLGVIP